MSMKRTDLEKMLAKKVDARMKATGAPGRFAPGAEAPLDRREQRRRDAAAGLVAFACKLPGPTAREIHDAATRHAGGLNGLVAELLDEALAARRGRSAG